jgi:hypothetical protein
MEVLVIRTLTQESNEAKMARFLHGLNDEISDFVEMFPYDTLQDVVDQSIRVEKKNMRNGRSRSLKEHVPPCVVLVINDNPYGLTFALSYIYRTCP